MATYLVFIPCTASLEVEVEAESREAAALAALAADFRITVEGDNAFLHEFELHKKIVTGNVFHGVQNEIEVDLIQE